MVGLASAAAEPATEWRFSALLDDRPIGTHTFALTSTADGMRTVLSEARFDVKFLGFTAYRYRHRAEERWNGNCLTSIAANTDDDGEVTNVAGESSNSGFTTTARTGKKPSTASSPGCVMSFAYWNVALADQRHLLDPGTGRIEAVTITELPTSNIEVRGQRTAVRGLRITGLLHPIDVWYSNAQWVGLDTFVEGGRRMSYRLK